MIADSEINQKLKTRKVADYLQGAGRQGLLTRWEKLIDELECGNTLGLHDYRNDIDIREIIEYCGLGKDSEVTALDGRFKALLTDTGRRIWQSNYDDAFWIYGYPRKISEEFTEDLARLKR